LGLADDIKFIITRRKGKFLGLDRKKMLILQLLFALAISAMLYFLEGLNNLYISGLGNFVIYAWYIPLATFIIVAFANAYNISDGLDGLSAGLLLICLIAFLALTSRELDLTLALIGGMFIIIVASSLLQILSKKIFKKKILPVSPLHMYFKYIGWEESKIVSRFWLAGGMFAILGLWISLLSR